MTARVFLAVLSARCRVLLQYRSAAIAGFGTQLFWGLIRMMIFSAFYASSDAHQPMSLPETISYVWLGQALLLLLPWWLDGEVEEKIRSGAIAYELVRPVDLYAMWYARGIAQRFAPALLRCVPMLLVAGLLLGLRPPASPAALAAFLVHVGAAVLLGSAMTTLMAISLIWTVSGAGVRRLLPAAANLLSGIVVPLPLLPDWMQPIVRWLPFRGLMDVPFRLWIGHIPARQAAGELVFTLAWTAVLVLLGRGLLRLGLRRVVVQGG